MEGGGKRVGCRVRRNKYLENYGREFTIRSNRNSGAETELSKILDGWGDYFYYGFSDPYNEHIAQWFVGDLGVFRGYVHQNGWVSKNNTDQETSFAYFNVDKLPDNFVLLASWK